MLITPLKRMYTSECVYYKIVADEDTLTVWKDVLLSLDERQVAQAIGLWHNDTGEIEVFGQMRSRGSMMPKASDIKLLVERMTLPDEDYRVRDAKKNAEEIEQFFWDHVDFRMEETGWSEQKVLDSIKQPGFTGRRAGTRPPRIYFCRECEGMGMIRFQQGGVNKVRDCYLCKSTGRAA